MSALRYTRWFRFLVFALVLVLGAGVATAQQPGDAMKVWPQPDSKDNAIGSTITIDFAVAMDHASTEAAFSVDPTTAGHTAWSTDSRHFEFRSEEPLTPLTTFRALLGTGALNARGQPIMSRAFSWSFTTAAASNQMRFGYNMQVQLVTPQGGRGVPIQPGVPRLTLDLGLYRVDMPGFAARYAKLVPYQNNEIPVAGLAQVAHWQQHVDASDVLAAIALPKDTAPGLYVLDARHPLAGEAQTFVIFSDYGIVAKAGRTGRSVWVTHLFDGSPAAGARVALLDADGKEIASTNANADGVAHFADGTQALFATADGVGQPTLVGLDQYWASDGYYWWWFEGPMRPGPGGRGGGPQLPAFAGHVHTDRPIYRPGHTVHYKATLRAFADDGYQVVASTVPVTVTIQDNQGNTVAQSHPTPDAFGSIAGDFVLGDEAPLGGWNVEVTAVNQSFWGYFDVQAYVKPDFAVTVAPERPYYVRGDLARLNVAANYYFGQPAAGADVTLKLFRGYYTPNGTPTSQVQGTLAADGTWSADMRLPDDGNAYVEYWYFEAEVVDKSRRPVVASGYMLVHPAAFDLTLTSDRYGVEVGSPVHFTAATIDHDGNPVAGRTVAVEVQQYRNDGQHTIRQQKVVTGADGKAAITLTGLDEGWYGVTARASDDARHEVTANNYAWLYSTRQSWYWWGGLEIAADRDSYAPGDTARLLIKSPVTTTALVTIERGQVYDEIVVPVSGATAVEVPIKADYAPNVFARVQLWQPQSYEGNRAEGQLLVAETTLVVPAKDKRLSVEVVPDAAKHAPGESATFTLKVHDAAGQPVVAQLSLALVDKAVLALSADKNGDIFDAFWGQRYERAVTYNSLQPSNWYGYKESDGRAGGGQPPVPGAPGGSPTPAAAASPQDKVSQATPRRDFPDTAYWNPTIVTNAAGEATVTLKLPDSLTTWQALAVAVTKDTRVGQGKGELVVTKAIMADPALPRFAVQGDQFVLDVLARNYTGGELAATTSLDTPGLVQLDPGERALTLPFNDTRFSRWSVVASTVGTQDVTARVTTAQGDDAIALPLDIQSFTVPDRFVRAGGTESTVAETFDVPFNAEPKSSSVEVRLAPAMAVSVLDGLESLIDYPYGCVEQTMSRLLPNAVVGRLVLHLDIQAPEITKRLPELMNLGLQKLYGFQNSDGSWGWWKGAEGNLYTSAYVLSGLTMSTQAGFDVDPDVLNRGFTWLSTAIDGESDARLKAYALYVMAEAGRGDADRTVALWSNAKGLDSFSLGALAVALHRVGRDDLAGQAVDSLVARAVETPTTASWPLPAPDEGKWWWESYYWRSMASSEKNTAMALETLAVLRPTSPLAPKAARWLLEHRYGHGWSSTQATAFAVLGLTDYINASGELHSNYDWSAQLDGTPIASGHVDATNVTKRIEPITLTGPTLTPGQHTLTLSKQGNGTLFYTALGRLALYYDGFAATNAHGIGMTLDRQYMPTDGTKGADSRTTGWHIGDVVNVRLTLTTQEDLWYVMLDDKLPAGLEGLNEQLDTETKRAPGDDQGGWPWRWWGYERKEMRDDGVNFFATYLSAGTHTFDYAARAVTPGTFAARPAEASAMYRPELWARSPSAQFAIDTDRVKDRPALAGDFDRDCRLTDFDASLVAADWADGKGRDLTGDLRVTVGDIALAGGRAGVACGQGVGVPPGKAGDMALSLRTTGEPVQGQVFTVDVVADGHGNVGGYEATVTLPEGAFEVVGLAAGAGFSGARLLGPVSSSGTVRIGGFLTQGVNAGGETVLARLTLKAMRAGAADLKVTSAQVVTDKGGEYTVTANGLVVSPTPWTPKGVLLLPYVAHP